MLLQPYWNNNHHLNDYFLSGCNKAHFLYMTLYITFLYDIVREAPKLANMWYYL